MGRIVAATLTERIKILVEREIGVLESWSVRPDAEGTGGLTENQLERMEALARIVRQLDLDSVEQSEPPTGRPAATESELLKAVGYDTEEA